MYQYTMEEQVFIVGTENRIDKIMSRAIPADVWMQMAATSSTCHDIFTFLTQRTYSCSNFVAISSLVLELLKKCRVW
jgi:hypothetical protein